MILAPCAAFADTANVALMLTVEAAPLDFTVTDSLSMHATQGQTALTIDSLAVTNTGTEDLKVSSIAITPAAGWSVEANSTDFATAAETALGFTCSGHDFSTGAYLPGDSLIAGESLNYSITGQISANASLTAAVQVATLVITIEEDTPQIIRINMDGCSAGYATAGMTWEEWMVAYDEKNCEWAEETGAIIEVTDFDGRFLAIDGDYVVQPPVGAPDSMYLIESTEGGVTTGRLVRKDDVIVDSSTGYYTNVRPDNIV